MTKLEYRLNDKQQNYPALYHYPELRKSEVFCRRLCDYFIKDQKVFHKTATALEGSLIVIYIEEDIEETVFQSSQIYSHITMEIRQYCEDKDSTLLYTYDLYSHDEALSYIGSDFLVLNSAEFEKISAEIDEDRSTYVLYVSPTGEKGIGS